MRIFFQAAHLQKRHLSQQSNHLQRKLKWVRDLNHLLDINLLSSTPKNKMCRNLQFHKQKMLSLSISKRNLVTTWPSLIISILEEWKKKDYSQISKTLKICRNWIQPFQPEESDRKEAMILKIVTDMFIILSKIMEIINEVRNDVFLFFYHFYFQLSTFCNFQSVLLLNFKYKTNFFVD